MKSSMVDGAVPKALQLASSKAPKVGGDTCRRTVNKGGLSCLTGKLSHRPSGIFEQLLVLRHPPCEAGAAGVGVWEFPGPNSPL